MEEIETTALTAQDVAEFLSATGEERWEILLAHAERNKKTIHIRRSKTMEQTVNTHEEISKQFEEFCQTKGIKAKFKIAFEHMAENTRKQKEADKARLAEVRRQAAQNNPEFTEFLHTKGVKAKVKLVIENIKNGAKQSTAKVRKQIAEAKHGVPHVVTHEYSAQELTREFNEFLRAKGLDGKYIAEVTDEDEN